MPTRVATTWVQQGGDRPPLVTDDVPQTRGVSHDEVECSPTDDADGAVRRGATVAQVALAWQFHQPDQDAGVVEAFRRPKSAESARVLRLGGLDRGARYAIANLDTNEVATIAGKDLMEKGLRVEIAAMPGAATITYQKSK